jgi:hypothetical protein
MGVELFGRSACAGQDYPDLSGTDSDRQGCACLASHFWISSLNCGLAMQLRWFASLISITCQSFRTTDFTPPSHQRQRPNRRAGRAAQLQRNADEGELVSAFGGQLREVQVLDDVDALLRQ